MNAPSHLRTWVLLFLGLSVTGLLAWGGFSMLGKSDRALRTLDETQEEEGASATQGKDVPQGKGLGGLDVDREKPQDLEISVEILGPLSEQGQSSEFTEGTSRLTLISQRAGKPVPFRWQIEAGPEAGRASESPGEVALTDLRPGWYLLSLRGPGGAQAPRLLQLHADRRSWIRVDWTYAGRARGRVFGPQGEPVRGAHVSIGQAEAETDEEGRFELTGLWPGSGLPLLIEAEGLASRVEPIGVVASSEPPKELRFVLEEGAEVVGLVELPREQRKHARLYVLPGRPTGRSRSGRGYAHLPLFWKHRFSDLRLDEQGRFRIRGLSRSLPLALGFVHPRYRLAEPIALPVLERVGKAHAQVLLQPQAMRILTGKITAKDGKAVQARLEMRGKGRWGEAYFRGGARPPLESSAAAMGDTVTASGADGRYSVGVAERGSELRVIAPGFEPREEPVPNKGPANIEMQRGITNATGNGVVLRILLPVAVTEEGLVRAVRVTLTRQGQDSPGTLLIDPRKPYSIRFGRAARVRMSIGPKGAAKPTFSQVLELRGNRSLRIR